MGKRLQTVVAVACMKTLLMIFNLLFWLSGILILVIGVWMQVRLNKYVELSDTYFYTAPYIFMATGGLMAFAGTLAYCCTAKGQPILLYLYSAFLLIMFIVVLTAGISGYAFRAPLRDGFKVGLKNAMDTYDSDAEKRLVLNTMQSTLKCCGRDDYSDWFNSKWANGTRSVPNSCCKHDIRLSECHHDNLPNSPDQPDIYMNGCFPAAVDFVNGNLTAIGGIALGVAFFQLLGVLLACCLAKNINKAKYEEVE